MYLYCNIARLILAKIIRIYTKNIFFFVSKIKTELKLKKKNYFRKYYVLLA